MTRPALLDVNVLVALFDPDHVHHEPAHEWFAANRAAGWATCPITENAVVRILSNVAYRDPPEPPAGIVRRLKTFCASGQHVFWPDEISLRDEHVFASNRPVTHRQLTDVYLLGLATRKNGRLATFDRSIPLAGVVGASPDNLAFVTA